MLQKVQIKFYHLFNEWIIDFKGPQQFWTMFKLVLKSMWKNVAPNFL